MVVVKSIVDLAAALGIRSVAEGVESAEVAAALLAMGCVAGAGLALQQAAERRVGDRLAGRARRRRRAQAAPIGGYAASPRLPAA